MSWVGAARSERLACSALPSMVSAMKHVRTLTQIRLGALLLLYAAAPGAASATILQDDTIVGTTTHDFEAVPVGVLMTLSLPGAIYRERFVGQTLSSVTSGGITYDVLSGTPTSPLALMAAPTSFSLAVTTTGSEVPGKFLAGCGPVPANCAGTFSIGEGAVSVLFGEDVQVFGFEFLGDGLGNVGVQFFSRSGTSLGAFALPTASGVAFMGFRVADGESIAGVSLTNTDPGGGGYGSVTFGLIPEPSTASLLLLGLALLGLFSRAKREQPSGIGRTSCVLG